VLENLRFHAAEEANDRPSPASTPPLADVYVNDAFGTAHRSHASTAGSPAPLPVRGGLPDEEGVDFLGSAHLQPGAPFVAIIGGAKISGKIDVIEALLPKVDQLLIGGGMAYTFFKARAWRSQELVEADKIELARSLLAKGGSKLMLPVDCRISPEFDFKARTVGAVTRSRRTRFRPIR
jgi:phosphoglycerate kinase